MTSLKLVALACLVAVATANPTFPIGVAGKVGGVGDLVGNAVGTVGDIVDGALGTVGNVVGGAGKLVGGILGGVDGGVGVNADLSLNLGGLLNILAGGCTDVGGSAGVAGLLRGLLNFGIPGTINDVLDLVAGLGSSVGLILDAVLPGVADLVGGLLGGVLKILFCVLGSLGFSRVPFVCSADFGPKYGIRAYTGSYDDLSDVFDFYGLGDIDGQIRALINAKTNGKGLSSLTNSQRYVLQQILEISSMFKSQRTVRNLSKKDVLRVITSIIKSTGAVGNAYKKDLGKRLVKQLIKYFRTSSKSTYFSSYDWNSLERSCISEISQLSRASFGGAIKEQSDESYSAVVNNVDKEYSYEGESSESSEDSALAQQQQLQQALQQAQQRQRNQNSENTYINEVSEQSNQSEDIPGGTRTRVQNTYTKESRNDYSNQGYSGGDWDSSEWDEE